MMLLAMLLLPQEAGPADSIAQTFGVDGPHLLAQVISFAIVCALLYRLAYTPVLTMLDARRQQIAQGLPNPAKINAALAAIDAQRQAGLIRARDGASHLVAAARRAAKRVQKLQARRPTAEAEP